MPNTDAEYMTISRKDYETMRAALTDAINATTPIAGKAPIESCDPARARDYQRLLAKLND